MNNILRLIKFLKYFIFADHKRGHGIHSPFVYDLIREVFIAPVNKEDTKDIEEIRREMKSDSSLLTYRDPGAGSGKMKSSRRRVKDIARYAASRKKYSELLYKLAAEFRPAHIIELGSSLGIGCMYLARGNPDARVYSIEGAEPLSELAGANIERAGISNVTCINNTFKGALDKLTDSLDSMDMVFFDGDHDGERTWDYYEKCLEKAGSESVFIFDDIYWSPGMEKLWKRIVDDTRVKISIDLYQMGLVFFREGIVKQHFVIKY